MKISRKQQVNRRQSNKRIVRGGNPKAKNVSPKSINLDDLSLYESYLVSFKLSSKNKIPASIIFNLGYTYLWENIKEIGNLIPKDDISISNFTEKSPSSETYLVKFTIQIDTEYGPQRFKKEYLEAIKSDEKKNPSGFNIKITNFTIKAAPTRRVTR
jgi:hypothetical protein